jgi:hypothetical protein
MRFFVSFTHWSKAVGGGEADAAGVAVWAWVMADVAANAPMPTIIRMDFFM